MTLPRNPPSSHTRARTRARAHARTHTHLLTLGAPRVVFRIKTRKLMFLVTVDDDYRCSLWNLDLFCRLSNVCIHVHVHIYVYVYLYVCIHVYVHVYVYVYVYVGMCTCI